MILILIHENETLAVIEARGHRIQLVHCVDDLKQDLLDLVTNGINNPSISSYYDLNAAPHEAVKLLNSISQLYEMQFGIQSKLVESVLPVTRLPDLELRFPNLSIGQLDYKTINELTEEFQKTVYNSSMFVDTRYGKLRSRKRRHAFRLNPCMTEAASLKLGFYVGDIEGSDSVSKTINFFIGAVNDPIEHPGYKELYRCLANIEEMDYGVEISGLCKGERLHSEIRMGDRTFLDMYQRIDPYGLITITGSIFKTNDRTRFFGVEELESDKTFNCYFDLRPSLYDKFRNEDRLVRIVGIRMRRQRIDRIEVRSIELATHP